MKLRNKRTGDIIIKHIAITVDNEYRKTYSSLAELNEEWEDYKPAEPLIKNEKIRKAVRAWAEAESIPSEETLAYNVDGHSLGWYHCEIMFSKHIQGLEEKEYTIAELCGEEKE